MNDGDDTLRQLRELEESTDWELSGDVLAVNDPEGEDSSVAILPRPDEGSGLDSGEEMNDILSCVLDMVANKDVVDILVIVNMVDDDQTVLTTLDRNDIIIGTLETAKMNWFATQVDLQNMEDVEGGEV